MSMHWLGKGLPISDTGIEFGTGDYWQKIVKAHP
jgi:hypothetical protein